MAQPITTPVSELLARYRDYLVMLGRAQFPDRLDGRIDLSGVVQVTLHEAALSSKMNELTDEERLAWLRRVFANNLTDEVRRLQADNGGIRQGSDQLGPQHHHRQQRRFRLRRSPQGA